MKMSSTGGWFALTALLALLGTARAADSLEPAVNTSAPERAPAATLPPATAPVAPAAPAAAADRLAVPAAKGAAAAPAPAAAPVPAKVSTPAAAGAAAARAAPTRAPAAAATARDRVELENTQITGNRELPKVMYVVPWKKPDLGDFGGRPAKSLLDELLEPVDRDVFRRQNRYFEALQPDAAAASAGDEK